MSAATADHLPGIDLEVLAEHLTSAGVAPVGPLSASPISGGRSNLTYRVSDATRTWVLRRPPVSGRTPSAHDVAREFRVMSALADTGVPVPTAVLSCADESVMGAPFTLVSHVSGRCLQTQADLADVPDADLERCCDDLLAVLTRLHAVVPGEVGLADFGRPGYIRRQVALWHRQWELVSKERSSDLDRLHASLADRIPEEQPLAVVHGDFRVDNCLLSEDDLGEVKAVIDWELSALGDARADLAMMCAYRHPAFDLVVGEPAAWTSPRLPSADELAHRYAAIAGTDLGDWSFYIALAHFKVAVIAEGIRHRHEVGSGDGPGFATAGQAVAPLLAAGLSALTT